MEENVNIGISPETRTTSAALLNGLLADHFVAMLKIWQFHWNVVGKSFGSYHEDMRKLYDEEFDRVDDIAERIRALGMRPLGSLDEMLKYNTIPEYPQAQPVPSPVQMWQQISADWDALIRRAHEIHANISEQDIATKSFLEGMCESMEKTAWMIRARVEVGE